LCRKRLFDKLWAEADKNELSQIRKYDLSLQDYPDYLDKNNFKDIKMEVIASAIYNPDSSNINEEMALEMINENRLFELCSVQKAKAMAPSALTSDDFNRLIEMVNERYDIRIKQYKSGEKLWDFSAGITLAASGRK